MLIIRVVDGHNSSAGGLGACDSFLSQKLLKLPNWILESTGFEVLRMN